MLGTGTSKHPAELTFSVPHALHINFGILTCFPSATHLCSCLLADSPYADERCVGNLGAFGEGLFTPF